MVRFPDGLNRTQCRQLYLLGWPSHMSVCQWSCTLGFASELGQTNYFKIVIHSLSARRLALKEQCGKQAGKFTNYAEEKGT